MLLKDFILLKLLLMKLLSGKKVLLLSTGKNKTFRVHLECVDKFKCSFYISVMKFTVEKLPQAKAEIESLEQSQKDLLKTEYKRLNNKELSL